MTLVIREQTLPSEPLIEEILTPKQSKKHTNEDIERISLNITLSIGSDEIKSHYSDYTGFIEDFNYDPSVMRPKQFIGPLEYTPLQDTPLRRVIWLALGILQTDRQIEDFFATLPHFEIVVEVKKPEILFIDPEGSPYKDCFDEAFKDDPRYQTALKTMKSYIKLKDSIFHERRPLELLNELNYRIVGPSSGEGLKVGDLIIYYSKAKDLSEKEKKDLLEKIFNESVNRPSHFGRIVKINKDNSLRIRSRFNKSHVYEHPMEAIQTSFGTGYIFARRR